MLTNSGAEFADITAGKDRRTDPIIHTTPHTVFIELLGLCLGACRSISVNNASFAFAFVIAAEAPGFEKRLQVGENNGEALRAIERGIDKRAALLPKTIIHDR